MAKGSEVTAANDNTGQPKILVVDDNELVRASLEAVFDGITHQGGIREGVEHGVLPLR